jgi:hypothetical protein
MTKLGLETTKVRNSQKELVRELKSVDRNNVTYAGMAFGRTGRGPDAFLKNSGIYSCGGANPLIAPPIGFYDKPETVYNNVSKRA